MPKTFWFDVIQAIVYLMNRIPSWSWVFSFKSPLEVLSFRTPLFSLPPKTFGCFCYVHIFKSDCTKLNQKTLKYVFVGYGVDQKGYKYFHPFTRKKFVSQDVIFFESIPHFLRVRHLFRRRV